MRSLPFNAGAILGGEGRGRGRKCPSQCGFPSRRRHPSLTTCQGLAGCWSHQEGRETVLQCCTDRKSINLVICYMVPSPYSLIVASLQKCFSSRRGWIHPSGTVMLQREPTILSELNLILCLSAPPPPTCLSRDALPPTCLSRDAPPQTCLSPTHIGHISAQAIRLHMHWLQPSAQAIRLHVHWLLPSAQAIRLHVYWLLQGRSTFCHCLKEVHIFHEQSRKQHNITPMVEP